MASQGSTSTWNAPNVALIKGDLACNSELCSMRRISNQVPPSLLPAPSKNTAVRNSLRITLLQVRSLWWRGSPRSMKIIPCLRGWKSTTLNFGSLQQRPKRRLRKCWRQTWGPTTFGQKCAPLKKKATMQDIQNLRHVFVKLKINPHTYAEEHHGAYKESAYFQRKWGSYNTGG